MRFIPTFILEHWIYKLNKVKGFFFVHDGKLYAKNFPGPRKETIIYRFEPATKEWIKVSKEGKIL